MSERDKVYAYVRDSVISNPASVGRFMDEREIAAQVGVSRTPVREALLILAAEDLIELIPRRGAYLAPLTPSDINELMGFRELLETNAARVVIGRRCTPVRAMHDALAAQEKLAGGDEPGEFLAQDLHFHSSLVEAAGNTLILKAYRGLRTRQLRTGLSAVAATPGRRAEVVDEHRAILSAVDSGDADAAIAAITDHLAATQKILALR
ncbi:GntR family transcriptional regulator [Amycolatopsis cynarae]|uniref:GntR family transcriptional regulator n=1 Tax=Amycolatopsis cynarae TaxID=2995223 RepID=A0ABY7BB92_9PSEU|nr:GntR family transcriptional regulator [Amycolatopsis sp. HUAS 11-8]WAL68497.1 GntR family transcriptional regulator [Amycolatopsis sp. HUAS 11-8]